MAVLLIAVVLLAVAVAVPRLRRASRQVDAILDLNTRGPAQASAPAPKENPAA